MQLVEKTGSGDLWVVNLLVSSVLVKMVSEHSHGCACQEGDRDTEWRDRRVLVC